MVWLLSNVLEYLCGCMLSVACGHEPQSGIAGPRGGSVSDELTKAGLSPTMAAPFFTLPPHCTGILASPRPH